MIVEISSIISLLTNIDPIRACSASILDGRIPPLPIFEFSIFSSFMRDVNLPK